MPLEKDEIGRLNTSPAYSGGGTALESKSFLVCGCSFSRRILNLWSQNCQFVSVELCLIVGAVVITLRKVSRLSLVITNQPLIRIVLGNKGNAELDSVMCEL